MIYLKEINFDDIDKEFDAIKQIPENENGFENKYFNIGRDEFKNNVIPKLINNANGIDLQEGRVPQTCYFLWDDDKIVGQFKIRHCLNDRLKNGAGHIGYCILKQFRGKGYASEGLKKAIEICKTLIKEDEIYLASHKDNPASLKVQLKCGAYIVGENDEDFFTRIQLNNEKNLYLGYRDLNRDDWKRLQEKTYKIEDIKTSFFEGKVCLVKALKVSSPLWIETKQGKMLHADNGFKYLIFAPKNQNWWLTVIYNEKDEIVESYFDITRLNDFYGEIPFFVDMKLDIFFTLGKQPVIIDENELQEIYDAGFITKQDFDNAYETANKLIDDFNSNPTRYYEFIGDCFNKMNK